jgi:hypothetical protein
MAADTHWASLTIDFKWILRRRMLFCTGGGYL